MPPSPVQSAIANETMLRSAITQMNVFKLFAKIEEPYMYPGTIIARTSVMGLGFRAGTISWDFSLSK